MNMLTKRRTPSSFSILNKLDRNDFKIVDVQFCNFSSFCKSRLKKSFRNIFKNALIKFRKTEKCP